MKLGVFRGNGIVFQSLYGDLCLSLHNLGEKIIPFKLEKEKKEIIGRKYRDS